WKNRSPSHSATAGRAKLIFSTHIGSKRLMKQKLRIIPLGGLGEIGKNMTVLEYGRDMIVVDWGGILPDRELVGIDLVLPQFDYVVKNQDRLRSIVLTHGHMDHIGALP